MAGVQRQQREVLTLGHVAVHLHVDAHCRQRLLGLKDCGDGRAVQQTDLYSKDEEEQVKEEERGNNGFLSSHAKWEEAIMGRSL